MNHWAVTYHNDGTHRVFKNGVLLDCGNYELDQYSGSIPYMKRNSAYIGKSNWNSDRVFKGVIEDLRVYKTVLGAD